MTGSGKNSYGRAFRCHCCQLLRPLYGSLNACRRFCFSAASKLGRAYIGKLSDAKNLRI